MTTTIPGPGAGDAGAEETGAYVFGSDVEPTPQITEPQGYLPDFNPTPREWLAGGLKHLLAGDCHYLLDNDYHRSLTWPEVVEYMEWTAEFAAEARQLAEELGLVEPERSPTLVPESAPPRQRADRNDPRPKRDPAKWWTACFDDEEPV